MTAAVSVAGVCAALFASWYCYLLGHRHGVRDQQAWEAKQRWRVEQRTRMERWPDWRPELGEW